MESSNNDKNIYINGKKQAVDLLKVLNPSERERILKTISLKNPSLARELSENCLSFSSLYAIKDDALRIIFNNTSAAMVGLSIKFTPEQFQKRVLTIVDRSLAVEAYEVMKTIDSSNDRECTRAQEKVLATAVSFSKRGLIIL